MDGKYTWRNVLLGFVLFLLSLVVLFPVAFVLMNSLKSLPEVTLSMIAFPKEIHLENFSRALTRMNYLTALGNSVWISVGSVSGVVLFSSMAAYQIVRRNNLLSKIIFYTLILSMAIPFQALMVPLVIVGKTLRLMNNQWGMILAYWGLLIPMATFLYQGFIKSVPLDMEEAARIDGCAAIPLFFRIVFPIIKPLTVSIIILNILGVFNDFALPLIMLTTKRTRTIPLAVSTFFGTYLTEWQLVMAGLTVTILPMIILFIFMQKHIVKGMVDGAVKG